MTPLVTLLFDSSGVALDWSKACKRGGTWVMDTTHWSVRQTTILEKIIFMKSEVLREDLLNGHQMWSECVTVEMCKCVCFLRELVSLRVY